MSTQNWILLIGLAALLTYGTRLAGVFLTRLSQTNKMIRRTVQITAPIIFLNLVLADLSKRIPLDGWLPSSLGVATLLLMYLLTRSFLAAILVSSSVYVVFPLFL